MDAALVELARVVSVHGIKGGVKAICLTSQPGLLKAGLHVTLSAPGKAGREAALKGASFNGKQFILTFEGAETPEKARDYVGWTLSVPRQALGRPEQGAYFVCDLKHLRVVDESGAALGTLVGVYETGAQDVYEIKPDQGETYLIPAIAQVVKAIDLKARTMTVRLMPGLGPEAGS